MMDQTMLVALLPVSSLIKNFVKGESGCNYEVYLLELINESQWFSNKYPGGFVAPASEAHGECDANNKAYQLDFKRFASKTALQACNIFSDQIIKLKKGGTLYCSSKKQNGQVKATRLFAAFRGKSMTDLNSIRECETKESGVKNDILSALMTLETQKNLLLFFPYEYSFTQEHSFKEAVKSISEGLENDFGVAFQYREIKTQSKYDTFLTCVYQSTFLIFLINNGNLMLIDTVEADKLPSYLKLKNYSGWIL